MIGVILQNMNNILIVNFNFKPYFFGTSCCESKSHSAELGTNVKSRPGERGSINK